MAITTQQISERLLKKSQGVVDTKYPLSQRGITEEAVGTYNLVRPNDIWADASNIPTTPPILSDGATLGVVKYYEKLQLQIVDGGTTVSFKSPSGETIDMVTGKFAFGYIPKIYNTDGTVQIFKGSPIIDVETGIITFYDINESGIEATINAANPPRISFYKYVGAKGIGTVGDYLPITGGTLTGKLGSTISDSFLTGTTSFRQFEGNLTRYTGNTSTVTEGFFENVTYSGTTNVSGLYGINLYTRNLNSATVANLYGVQSYARNDGSGKTTNIVGGYFSTRNNTTGSFNKMLGVQSVMTNNSADVTNNDMYGLSASMTNGSTGFTDSMAGLTSYIYNNGTVNEATGLGVYFPTIGTVNSTIYGVKIGSTEHPWIGSSPNMYGLYIHSSVTGGTVNNYGIYSDTTSKNYLKGGLGVKMLPTNDALSVSGDTFVYGNITGSTFVKSGGTSNQFLKADGTVDSNSYSLTGHTHNEYLTGPTGSTVNNIPVYGDISGSTLLDSGLSVDDLITKAIPVTYNELKALRDNSQLVPLQTYLLTDYRTTYQMATDYQYDNYNGYYYQTLEPMGGVVGEVSNIQNQDGVVRIVTLINGGSNYSDGNYNIDGGGYDCYIDITTDGNGSVISVSLSNGGNAYSDGTYTIQGGDYNATVQVSVGYKTYQVSGNTNPLEPLIITSSGVNTLETICKSTTYGQDIVYYNIDDNTEGFTKGKIYRRIDTINNNDIGTDWRHIKYRRWKLDVTNNWINGQSYNIGDIVKIGSTIYYCHKTTDLWDYSMYNFIRVGFNNGDYAGSYFGYYYNIFFGLNVYYAPYDTYFSVPALSNDYRDTLMFTNYVNVINNKIETYNIHNTVLTGNNFYSNTIGSDFYNNTIGNYFYSNTIGSSFYSNTIGNYFYSNTIGSSFYSNTIGNNFISNTIGNNFISNTIGSDFYSNTIGNNFNNNTIGNNYQYNTIGNYFYSNTIGNYFYSNTIGNNFYNNTIGNNFISNTIGNNFISNTIGSSFYSNTVFEKVNNKNFQGYSTYVRVQTSNGTTLPVMDTTNFDNSGSIKVNTTTYTYTGKTSNTLTGLSPAISTNIYSGTYVQFINTLSELYNKQYNHKITSTPNKVKIEWEDIYGDTNIIRI